MSHLFFLLLLSILLAIVRLSTANNRIVGGNNAIPKQFPHHVSLRIFHSHICGGSLISKRYILTAAHCVFEERDVIYPLEWMTVRVGTTNRIAGGIILPIKRIIPHPSYETLNDLALIELKEDLILSSTIQPIEMFDGKVPPNSDVIISGWGQTLHEKASLPVYLQYNELKSLSKDGCSKSTGFYTDALICVNHLEGTGVCFGDSGGPATYNNKLIGVASFINATCGSPSPSAYGNVTYNRDWILKTIT